MSDSMGQFFGKVAGKLVNAANVDRKLKCACCEKITQHISISYSDATKAGISKKAGGERAAAQVLGVIADYGPAYAPILVGNPYACTECQTIRYEGGIMSASTTYKLE